jgi:hypothetical protein
MVAKKSRLFGCHSWTGYTDGYAAAPSISNPLFQQSTNAICDPNPMSVLLLLKSYS